MSLTWISVSGDEYQARLGSIRINLKPIEGGRRIVLMDSKEGTYYRRERAILTGPMENAMKVAEGRYVA